MPSKLSDEAAEAVKLLAEKAAPHRINIMDTLGKKMTFLRQSFVLHFVKDIDKKKDKEEYVATKIEAEKTFRKIKDYIHYEGQDSDNPKYDGLNKLDKLLSEVALIVPYLRYIEHTENLNSLLAKYGMTLNTRDITVSYPVLAEEGVKDNVTKVMESANSLQSEICQEANEIVVHIFDELSEDVKYDSKTNKTGIRSGEFNKLTTLEAVRQKSEELAEKKLDAIKDSTVNTIDSKINVQLVAQTIAG